MSAPEPSRWLLTGDDAYHALLAAIDGARLSVRLETYVYTAGPLGEQFREALINAARRGLKVTVLVDAFGSINLTTSFWQPLIEAGGDFRWFNPLSFRRFTFRDHRKVLICDDDLAFVGGYNIAPEFVGDGVTKGWRDVGLRLGGDLARQLAEAFDAQFRRADLAHELFTRFRRSTARQWRRSPEGDLLLSGPGRGRNAIKHSIMADLRKAREVSIIAAYFLPTGRLRRALVKVARRGGRVNLVLPSKSDVPLMRLAGRAHYRRFLTAGIEVREYQPQILHSKLVLIDDAVYVGSANLDARSLYINYELMVRMTEPGVVAGAREAFADHWRLSAAILPATWGRSRSVWQKLQERWASILLGRFDPVFMRWQLRGMIEAAANRQDL
ncbi:MAG: phospholipase D-like domain-containing protein [Limisphaerales bacterium]